MEITPPSTNAFAIDLDGDDSACATASSPWPGQAPLCAALRPTPPQQHSPPIRRWTRPLASAGGVRSDAPVDGRTATGPLDISANSPQQGKCAQSHPQECRFRQAESTASSKVGLDEVGKGWMLVHGDDATSSKRLQDARQTWRQTVASCSAMAPFEDLDFPCDSRSISGRPETQTTTSQSKSDHEGGSKAPHCRCGTDANNSQVKKEGPTKGRPYWHCPTRRCGFFMWADAEARRSSHMWWQRFPDFHVVSDFGFRAEDLRQGGVGDCWFMSALAVIAERPDLILRLFGGETSRNPGGCYQMQLFLDGEWQAVMIDDRLPCTDQQRRPDGSGIAYSRTDGQQLWTSLVEKAYAKAAPGDWGTCRGTWFLSGNQWWRDC